VFIYFIYLIRSETHQNKAIGNTVSVSRTARLVTQALTAAVRLHIITWQNLTNRKNTKTY